MDDAILLALNGVTPSLAKLLSSPWMLLAVAGPIAVRLAAQRRFRAMLSIALAIGAADLISVRVIKPLVDRPRPCHVREDIVAPAGCGPGKSFPSAHASNAFALAVSAAGTFKLGWAVLLPVATAVALSRVMLGVHYPSDILAGALLGGALGGLAWWLRTPKRRRCRAPESTSSSGGQPP